MDELVEETLIQEEIKDEIEDLSQLNPIQNRYAFWYRYDSGKGSTNYTNYNQSIKKIASFQSVERFWNVYDYMKRPADYKDIKAVEYHLFKDGISPFWEDSQNKIGGKWMLRLRKGIAAKYWEDILLAIVGEQFDVGAEICGAVLSVRGNEDIISVWNKTAENTEAVNKIRDQIRRIVHLPDIIPLEYKVHADSLNDKSSYRNPNMVFRASTRPGGDRYGGAGGGGGGGYRHYQGGEQQQQQQGGGYQHRNNDRSGWKQNNRNNWNGGNGNSASGNNNNGNNNGTQDKGAEDHATEGQPSQRRERTEGHNPRDRGDGHDNSGWRRTRGDGDHTADNRDRHNNGDNTRQYNNRDRGDYQQRNSNSSNTNAPNTHSNSNSAPVGGSGSNGSSVGKAAAPSSVYSAGSGSFASRVKGAADANTPPQLTVGESSKSPTGDNWTKVNHLLPKGP